MTEISETPEESNPTIRVLNPEGSKGNGRFGWHFWSDLTETDDTSKDCE
ncbi:hypothetical protein ACWC5I_12935 [Kitasatospora sp. NPDC001574]